MAGTRTERLADIRAAVEGQVQVKRYYLSFQGHEERSLAEVARTRATAARLLADADRAEDAVTNWRERYREACDEVDRLRALALEVENEDKIARLGALAEQVLALGGEVA